VEIKEGQKVRGTLERVSFESFSLRVFFTLVDCDETFWFKAITFEQHAALALTKVGDEVIVQVDSLPREGWVCEAVMFVNLDLNVKHGIVGD
jgi:hypothetical protein